MEKLTHPALGLPPEVKKEQVHNASTLKAYPLASYLAGEPLLCGRVQQRLLADPRRSVQCALAGHPSALRSIQVALAAHPSQYVRRALGRNPSLHPEAALLLAADEHQYVQLVLARNNVIDSEVLRGLGTSPHLRVRQEVAGNAMTPPELLAEMVHDEVRGVWFRAVRNPSTPLWALMGVPVPELVKKRYEYNLGSVLEEHYERDPRWEMLSSLSENWEGSLEELLDACQRLHPQVGPASAGKST